MSFADKKHGPKDIVAMIRGLSGVGYSLSDEQAVELIALYGRVKWAEGCASGTQYPWKESMGR